MNDIETDSQIDFVLPLSSGDDEDFADANLEGGVVEYRDGIFKLKSGPSASAAAARGDPELRALVDSVLEGGESS